MFAAQVGTSKSLTQSLDHLVVIKNIQLITILDVLFNNGNKLGVVVDGDCEQTGRFFKKVGVQNVNTEPLPQIH